jgi:ankyrin repeat protein
MLICRHYAHPSTRNRGANLHSVDDQGVPLFLAAVTKRKWNVVTFLIDCGVDVDLTAAQSPETALMWLIEEGSKEALKLVPAVVGAARNVDATNSAGETALIIAVRKDNDVAVSKLLEKGASPDCKSTAGLTPLLFILEHWDQLSKAESMFKKVLEAKPDLELCDSEGYSALHLAVKLWRFELGVKLLNKGARVSSTNNEGMLPVMTLFASPASKSSKGYGKMSKYLVDKSNSAGLLDTQDVQLKTAIFHAVDAEDADGVQVLLAAGANADVSSAQEAPIHVAVKKDNADLVKLLMPRCTLSARDDSGNTPLALAALLGSAKICGTILHNHLQTVLCVNIAYVLNTLGAQV